jgi:hypothetical protein
MQMSRRQFFRGFAGKDGLRRPLSREEAIDAYVRTNLLPYDFCLTDDQLEQLLEAVRSELAGAGPAEISNEERRRMAAIAREMIHGWRDHSWKADEKRRDAIALVHEFLETEATAECVERMRNRFQISSSRTLEDEVERLATSWLYGLPNAHLSSLNPDELKNLVFAEMRAWSEQEPE